MISWEQVLKKHNLKHGTTFSTPDEMLASLSARHRSILRLEDILIVSAYAIRARMIKVGIPLIKKGGRYGSGKIITQLREMGPEKISGYTARELGEITASEPGSVRDACRTHGFKLKRVGRAAKGRGNHDKKQTIL